MDKLFLLYKNRLIFSIIGLFVLAVIIILLTRSCGGWQPSTAEKSEILQTVHDTVKVTKTETKTVYEKDIAEIKDLKGLISILRGDTSKLRSENAGLIADIEEIRKEIKDKNAQIRSLLNMQNSLQLQLSNIPTSKVKDSVYYAEFAEPEGWYKGEVNFDSKVHKFGVSLTAKDTLNVVFYSKKINNIKQDFFEVQNSNPYVTIRGLNNFAIPQREVKQRRFGIGLTAGYGALYNPQSREVLNGFGIMGGLYYRIL